MNLSEVRPGEKFKIDFIPEEKIRAQILRFGISDGSEVICEEKVPGGPIIIKKNFQEIALGRKLAQSISITLKEGEISGVS